MELSNRVVKEAVPGEGGGIGVFLQVADIQRWWPCRISKTRCVCPIAYPKNFLERRGGPTNVRQICFLYLGLEAGPGTLCVRRKGRSGAESPLGGV